MSKDLEYDFADKAWQVVLGCDNTIPCWRECWAKRTVNRLAGARNAKVAAAHSGLVRLAGPADKPVLAWTGAVRINEAHLMDPLKWRNPAVIATGFHGDWPLLPLSEKIRMFNVMLIATQHRYFPLMKHNLQETANWLSRFGAMDHVNIGLSLMTQADADAALPHMQRIAGAGWKAHVWHEPAIGPIDWRGWEFLSWLVVGGQSNGFAPFDLQWARDPIAWGRANGVPIKIKQVGSNPTSSDGRIAVEGGRGADWSFWPEDIRVRQIPGTKKAAQA